MRFILLLFVLVLGACATHVPDEVLYSNFLDYKSNITRGNIIESSPNFFSKQLLDKLNLTSSEVTEQLLFKNYMAKQINNIEIIGDSFGCLTVNGYDLENMPMSFNLKYIEVEQRWLIDEINVLFANNEADLSKVPKCPSEYNN